MQIEQESSVTNVQVMYTNMTVIYVYLCIVQ